MGARRGSPLVLALGESEVILASDASAVVEHSRSVIYLRDDEIVTLRRGGKYEVTDMNSYSGVNPRGRVSCVNCHFSTIMSILMHQF